jgi:hypothetical protein
MGAAMVAKREPALGRMLGRLSLACAARPGRAIAGIVLITALMGLGMMRLSTESNLLDILPEDDPHTQLLRLRDRLLPDRLRKVQRRQ